MSILKFIFFIILSCFVVCTQVVYPQNDNVDIEEIDEELEEIDEELEEIDSNLIEEVKVDRIVTERKGTLNVFTEVNLILYSFILNKDSENTVSSLENILYAREELGSENFFLSNMELILDWQLNDDLHFYFGLLSDNMQNIIFNLNSQNIVGQNVLNKQPNFVNNFYDYFPANIVISSFDINYQKFHLQIGQKINFFIDENILKNEGVGVQLSYTNDFLQFKIALSPLSSSYTGFNNNSIQLITSQKEILTDFAKIQSWIFAGNISYQLNNFLFQKVHFSLSYMNTFSFSATYGKEKNSQINYFFIRVKNIFPSSVIEDRIQVVVDQDSFLELIKKNGTKVIHRIDSVNIPDEFIYEINLKEKNLNLDLIEEIVMNMKMKYNYQIYISLDKRNWQIVADSKDMNGGLDDISSTAEDRIRLNNNVPDYVDKNGNIGVGTDLPREIKIYFKTDQIYAPKNRNLLGVNIDIDINKNNKFYFSFVNNFLQQYFHKKNYSYLGQAIYQFQNKEINFDLGFKQATAGYTTRFDGISIFDFRNINNLGVTRYDNNSPFFRAFSGVEDNDNLELKNSGIQGYYQQLQDNFEPHVPYSLHYDYFFFKGKIIRNDQLFVGILDKNNNDLKDSSENNLIENISVIPGQTIVDFNFAWNKNFIFYASYITQDYNHYYSQFIYNKDEKDYKNIKKKKKSTSALSIQSLLSFDLKIFFLRKFNFSILGKYTEDNIPDHTYNQSHFVYFHIRDIVLFDALDAYKQVKVKLESNLDFNFLFLKFRNYLYGQGKIYLQDNNIEEKLEDIILTKNDFYNQHYYTNHLRKISLSKNLYFTGGQTFHLHNNSAVYVQNSAIYDLFIVRYGSIFISDFYYDNINSDDILLNKKMIMIRPFITLYLKERASKVSKMGVKLFYQRQNDLNRNYYSGNAFLLSFTSNIDIKGLTAVIGIQVFNQSYDLSFEDLAKEKLIRYNEIGTPLNTINSGVQVSVGIYSRY